MTNVPASTSQPTQPELTQDVLWGRPQFHAPSLDRLLAFLDFRSFARELGGSEGRPLPRFERESRHL